MPSLPRPKLCMPMAVALSSLAAAQERAWETTYDDPLRPGLVPVALATSPDGGAVVAGITRDFPLDDATSPADLVVTKFSANGDALWRVTRPMAGYQVTFDPSLVGMDVDSNGNVYVVEPRDGASRLVRFSASGALDWVIPVGTPGPGRFQVAMSRVDASVPNEIVVSGTHMENSFYPYLQQQSYDPTGALLFSVPADANTPLSQIPQILLDAATRDQGGRIYSMGAGDTTGNAGRVSTVVVHDSSGNFLWQRFLGSVSTAQYTNARDLDSSASGDVTVQSNQTLYSPEREIFLLTRIDGTGAEVFSRTWAPASNTDVIGHSIALLPGGSFVVAGSMQRSPNRETRSFALFWFDDQGHGTGVSFIPSAGATDEGAALEVMVDRDGNVLALGWSEHPTSEAILASYSPAGVIQWTRRIDGIRPAPSLTNSSGIRMALDRRGNVLSLTQDAVSGTHPTQDQALTLAKTMRGGRLGVPYCFPAVPNSTGQAAEIVALGTEEGAADNVTLAASGLPGGTTTLFLAAQGAGSIVNVGGGQGTLCLSGPIGRFVGPGQLRQATPAGDASLALDLRLLPQPTGLVPAVVGQNWRFQAWYRDLNPSSTSNLTDAIAVQWR